MSFAREEAVTKALTALHVMQRDSHYIIQDSKIAIVESIAGASWPTASWSDGLHQLVELKEGTDPSPQRVTMARMTYQRLFRRYRPALRHDRNGAGNLSRTLGGL